MEGQDMVFEFNADTMNQIRLRRAADFLAGLGYGVPFLTVEESGPQLTLYVTEREIPLILFYRNGAENPDQFYLVAMARIPAEAREGYEEERNLWESGLFLSHTFSTGEKDRIYLRASMPEYGEPAPEALASFMNQLIYEIMQCP